MADTNGVQELLKSLDAGENALLKDLIKSVGTALDGASDEEAQQHASAFLLFVRRFLPEALEGADLELPEADLEKDDESGWQTHLKNVMADNGAYWFGSLEKHYYGERGSGPGNMDVRGYGPLGQANPNKVAHSSKRRQEVHGRGTGSRTSIEMLTGVKNMFEVMDGGGTPEAKSQFSELPDADKAALREIMQTAKNKGVTIPERDDLIAMDQEDLNVFLDKLGIMGETRGGSQSVVDESGSGTKRRRRDISDMASLPERGAQQNLKFSDGSAIEAALEAKRGNKKLQSEGVQPETGAYTSDDKRIGVSPSKGAHNKGTGRTEDGKEQYGTHDPNETREKQPTMTEMKYRAQEVEQKAKNKAKRDISPKQKLKDLLAGKKNKQPVTPTADSPVKAKEEELSVAAGQAASPPKGDAMSKLPDAGTKKFLQNILDNPKGATPQQLKSLANYANGSISDEQIVIDAAKQVQAAVAAQGLGDKSKKAKVQALSDKAKQQAESATTGAKGIPDFSGLTLTPTGKTAGSTGAKFATDTEGNEWLIKDGSNNHGADQMDRVAVELVSNAIYREMGANVPVMGTYNGGLAYKLIDGSPTIISGKNADLSKHYMVDAYLANYDILGTGGASERNIIKGKDGNLYRIDHGGTMIYRAQGKTKQFGPKVTEVETLTTVGQFKHVLDASHADLEQQAKDIAAKLTDNKLDELTTAVKWSSPSQKQEVFHALLDRKDWMESFAAGAHKMSPAFESKLKANEAPAVDTAGPVGQINFKMIPDVKLADEPSLAELKSKAGDKQLSTGMIVVDKDKGTLWLYEPKGHYGGYQHTFPKGQLEEGLSPQQNAHKELWEETGLKAKVTGYIGSYDKSTSHSAYYLAEKTGGDPIDAGPETASVKEVTFAEAQSLLNVDIDKKILQELQGKIVDDIAESKPDEKPKSMLDQLLNPKPPTDPSGEPTITDSIKEAVSQKQKEGNLSNYFDTIADKVTSKGGWDSLSAEEKKSVKEFAGKAVTGSATKKSAVELSQIIMGKTAPATSEAPASPQSPEDPLAAAQALVDQLPKNSGGAVTLQNILDGTEKEVEADNAAYWASENWSSVNNTPTEQLIHEAAKAVLAAKKSKAPAPAGSETPSGPKTSKAQLKKLMNEANAALDKAMTATSNAGIKQRLTRLQDNLQDLNALDVNTLSGDIGALQAHNGSRVNAAGNAVQAFADKWAASGKPNMTPKTKEQRDAEAKEKAKASGGKADSKFVQSVAGQTEEQKLATLDDMSRQIVAAEGKSAQRLRAQQLSLKEHLLATTDYTKSQLDARIKNARAKAKAEAINAPLKAAKQADKAKLAKLTKKGLAQKLQNLHTEQEKLLLSVVDNITTTGKEIPTDVLVKFEQLEAQKKLMGEVLRENHGFQSKDLGALRVKGKAKANVGRDQGKKFSQASTDQFKSAATASNAAKILGDSKVDTSSAEQYAIKEWTYSSSAQKGAFAQRRKYWKGQGKGELDIFTLSDPKYKTPTETSGQSKRIEEFRDIMAAAYKQKPLTAAVKVVRGTGTGDVFGMDLEDVKKLVGADIIELAPVNGSINDGGASGWHGMPVHVVQYFEPGTKGLLFKQHGGSHQGEGEFIGAPAQPNRILSVEKNVPESPYYDTHWPTGSWIVVAQVHDAAFGTKDAASVLRDQRRLRRKEIRAKLAEMQAQLNGKKTKKV